MKYTILLVAIAIVIFSIPVHFSEPGFNGTNPGCDGSGCHTLEDGLVSASVIDLQVAITLNGTTSSVAGELLDANGTVVAVNNSTGNNPFTLTAPAPGIYTVNAGFKNPNRRWDSVMVDISVTDIGENASNPVLYKLYDNYPNPFNPSTVIDFSLPEDVSNVKLSIYNALGEKVAELVNTALTAGKYKYQWNAQNVATGMYIYELRTDNFVSVKKMLLLK